MDARAQAYFDAWNKHDSVGVGAFFAADGVLRDWEVEVAGRDNVAAANAKVRACGQLPRDVAASF